MPEKNVHKAASIIVGLVACFLLLVNARHVVHATTNTIPCGDTQALINAIYQANNSPATEDTLHLSPGCIYILDKVEQLGTQGNNGLPVITAPLRIYGHGAVLERVLVDDAYAFRFFETAEGIHLTIEKLKLTNGGVNKSGLNFNGGAVLSQGPLTITDCIFEGNHASTGGALYLKDIASISGSLFLGNDAASQGGAIAVSNPLDFVGRMVTITNTTITENKAPASPALFTTNGVLIQNSTIARNMLPPNPADFQAAIITNLTDGLDMRNTILDNQPLIDCRGVVNDLGGNIQSRDSCGFANTNIDPLLDVLADNGGPTPTIALLPGSPAIDFGISIPEVTTDQRGAPRPYQNGWDAGAYETRRMIRDYIGVDPQAALIGGQTTVRIRLVNDTGAAMTGLNLEATLPTGLTAANSSDGTQQCGGMLDTVKGETQYSLKNGVLGAGEECIFEFPITGTIPGIYILDNGFLSASQYPRSKLHGDASLTLAPDPSAGSKVYLPVIRR